MFKSQPLRSYTSLGQIVIYLVSTVATASHLCTSHLYPLLPHLRGWAGIMVFTFQSPGISPALWGQANGNNSALCPNLHNRKSQQGKCPNVIPPHFPGTAGQSKSNCPAPYPGYPTAIPVGGGRGYK